MSKLAKLRKFIFDQLEGVSAVEPEPDYSHEEIERAMENPPVYPEGGGKTVQLDRLTRQLMDEALQTPAAQAERVRLQKEHEDITRETAEELRTRYRDTYLAKHFPGAVLAAMNATAAPKRVLNLNMPKRIKVVSRTHKNTDRSVGRRQGYNSCMAEVIRQLEAQGFTVK